MSNKKIITALGATIAASLCCVTPILAVLAGSSTLASSFSWLAPYHYYLVAFTILVLLYAWYDKLKPSKEIDCACDEKEGFFSSKTFLAIITLFAVIMLSFPQWGNKVFDAAPSAESCSTGTCESEVSPKKKVTAKSIAKKPVEGSSCETGTDCDKQPFKKAIKKSVQSEPDTELARKVFNYMEEERKHPTDYKQVACSGSGLDDLDKLMALKKTTIDEMPPPVLKKLLDDEEEIVLLDVREVDHKDGGEIEAFESYSLTYGKLLFNVLRDLQDKGAVIVVYSKVGLISLVSAATLKEFGYKNVYSLKGGVTAWKLAGYPYEGATKKAQAQVAAKKDVTKKDVTKKVSACKTKSNCSKKPFDKAEKRPKSEVPQDPEALKVFKYMSDEYANPTPYKQKACAGSGRPEIDALMRNARTTVEEMSPMVLKKMIDNEDEFILFDAREVAQRSEGEIYADDVIEMSRGDLEFEVMNKIKDKDAVIVTYCRSGGRGLFAAQALKKLGYKNVYNLKGGLKAWATAGLPFDNGLGVVVKIEVQ